MRMRSAALIVTMALCACDPAGSGTDGGSGDGGTSDGGADSGTPAPAPTVTSTSPLNHDSDVAMNAAVTATLSAPMEPSTVTAATMTLRQDAGFVTGAVTYSGTTALFMPTTQLAANTEFTATITTGAKSLVGGLSLASPFVWSFTTGSSTSKGPAPVGLGSAGNFVVLAKTAISTVPPSVITGDLGLSPAAQSFVTGFSLVADATNVFARATQVTGKIYSANDAVPTPANLTVAVSNLEGAYVDAASRTLPDFTELHGGAIGGQVLVPGLYKWTSAISIASDVTLTGGANDVWIFQTSGDLSSSAATKITLSGGAQARNIFWQVAGKVTLGATSHFEGIVLCKTEVTLQTGASLKGRVLAQSQVALQQATVTQP